MTRKGKNPPKKHDPVPTGPPPEQLAIQCLELQPLLASRTDALRKMKSGELIYLLSTKWLRDWKEYVGWDEVTGDGDTTKKKGGRRHPGKINGDLLGAGSELYPFPGQLPQYHYLWKVLGEKKDKDEDYLAITQQIWDAFRVYYEGEQIKRPIQAKKGGYHYDSELLKVEVILADLQQQGLQDRIRKTARKNLKDTFPSDRLQFSTLWTIEQLKEFLRAYCLVQFSRAQFRLWKCFSYLPANPIVQGLAEGIKARSFGVKGRQIVGQRYQELELHQFLKVSHTLVVQLGQLLHGEPDDKQIHGYCQECVEKKTLDVTCTCGEVYYCSQNCRINDQNFHSYTCQLAFDSDDDEEWEKVVPDNQPTGLANLGNTCYMNSVIQSLMSLDHLREFLQGEPWLSAEDTDSSRRLLKKIGKTFKALGKGGVYQPWGFKGQIDYHLPPFRGQRQHDANDFLLHFLNLLNDCLRKQGDSAYHSLVLPFQGHFESTVTCPNCHIQKHNQQTFLQLSLPLRFKQRLPTFSYVVIESPLHIRQGRSDVLPDWLSLKASLRALDSTVFFQKDPEGLLELNQQQKTPLKAVKNLKGDLIFVQGVKRQQGQKFLICQQVTSKLLYGNRMKSQSGHPFPLILDIEQDSLGSVWLKLIINFFSQIPQIVIEAASIQEQYYQAITKVMQDEAEKQKEDKLQRNGSEQIKQKTEENIQEKQNEAEMAVVHEFDEKLKKLAQRLGLEVYILDIGRHKNVCRSCKKKCVGCLLGQSLSRLVKDQFEGRLEQTRIEIQLKDKLEQVVRTEDFGGGGDATLQQCLEHFEEGERLDEQNAWFCEDCQDLGLALKSMRVTEFPKTLILHINRFKGEGKKAKNSDPLRYRQIELFGGRPYRLIASVVHQGTIDAGHYWAVCFRGGAYRMFNDAKAGQIEKGVQRGAYLMIYQQE